MKKQIDVKALKAVKGGGGGGGGFGIGVSAGVSVGKSGKGGCCC